MCAGCKFIGPIPAHAGEPGRDRNHHPRQRPIPAHAGEPAGGAAVQALGGAYPRSRGGTFGLVSFGAGWLGLSPLTRGNRLQPLLVAGWWGPIPAHAGEPRSLPASVSRSRAYPRSRGGTFESSASRLTRAGLSPLTRGNRLAVWAGGAGTGPIPAHAGEPSWTAHPRKKKRAYPRSRGGTIAQMDGRESLRGLSPLTRGNHGCAGDVPGQAGPIPAHAGEPL